jgi:hypothetical protein
MIIDVLIYILHWLTSGLDLIIPNWALPDEMMTAVGYGMEIVYFFDELFPIHVIIELILLFISFELTILLVKLIIGLIAMLRGSGQPKL